MAKFRFSQEKQITTWVRDYYYIEAESLEDAIAIVEDADKSLEELESQDCRVFFDERDAENSLAWSFDDNGFPTRYCISSCDTEDYIIDKI
jgi:hypothetical protein